MSTTTKSPKRVATVAYRVGKRSLAPYNSRYSPQKYTQAQLFACLVLKSFLKTDYRGVVQILNDCRDLRAAIELKHVPHFTTLQKASRRLLRSTPASQLLHGTARALKRGTKIKLAAMDSTGLEAGHISRYFVRRKRSKQLETAEQTHYRRWPKLAVACDCSNHMILSAVGGRGPGVDVNQFERILTPAAERYAIQSILADAGYDSESNHRFARQQYHIETIIPPKRGRPPLSGKPLKGTYREEMRIGFNRKTYGQRWQVETVMSMIKRNLGETVYARSYWSQCREMMLLVLTHNLAIILWLIRKLFYRASRAHLYVR